MIWLILAAVSGTLALATYTEMDWEYGTDRGIRRARAFGALMALLTIALLANAF